MPPAPLVLAHQTRKKIYEHNLNIKGGPNSVHVPYLRREHCLHSSYNYLCPYHLRIHAISVSSPSPSLHPSSSLTPVANNRNNIRLQTPKSELEGKIYKYVSSTTQTWPNKIIKIFLIEDFFHLPPVSLTPMANLELWISPQIFEKIQNGLVRHRPWLEWGT